MRHRLLRARACACSMSGMRANGMNGSATFDGQTLTIMRGGFSRQGRSEKVIPLHAIGAAQLRKPSFGAIVGDGAWSVSVMGEMQSSESRRGRGNARRQGKYDENTILIGPGHVKAFEALTAEINAAKAAPPAPVVVQAPAPAVAPAPAPAPAVPLGGDGVGEVVAQLRGVGEMHHRGVLDDEAFIREMHRLLPMLPRS